jgi:hypothetical protein
LGRRDGRFRANVLALPALRHGPLQRGAVNLGFGLALILGITFLSPLLFDILARA